MLPILQIPITVPVILSAVDVRILTIIHPGVLMIIHPPLGRLSCSF